MSILDNENLLILQSLPIGVALFDSEGNMAYVNEAYINIFGIYDNKEIIGSKHNFFRHPLLTYEEKNMIVDNEVASFDMHIDLRNPATKQFFISSLDEDKYVHVDCRKKLDLKGNIDSFIVIISDITAQTKYKQKLEQSDTRTGLTFSGSNMTQYDYDVATDTFIIYYNDRLFAGQKEISLDEYLSYFHPEDAVKYSGEVVKMRAGKDFSYNLNYRIKTPDEVLWHYMNVINVPLKKDASGKVVRYTGIRRDETKWNTMLSDLEKTNLLLKTVTDNMPCIFFMKDVDDDYRYVLANIFFCDSLGRDEKEVIGYTDYQIMKATEEADKYRRDDIEAVKKGLTSFREETFWKYGRKVWHTTKLLLETTSGQRYLIGMSLDISSLDTAFDELRHAKEKAERSDLLKSTFLANMSHEIRTPLNAIVGFANLLQATDDKDEKAGYSQVIANNSDLLLKLINDILDISKIEAGFIDLKREPVDISAVISGCYSSFAHKMKDDIKFVCENPYKSCIINSDKNRLIQVINNYMSNAVKYTRTGMIVLGYKYENNGIKIYVRDTGIGISEENKQRVFRRFEKFDSFAQGTGLGLSICKVIVESLGGEVGFCSTKGKGSDFYLFIPCSPIIDGVSTDAGQQGNPAEAGKTKYKILVAEDNDSNYVLLTAILKDFEVERAKNGLDAVSKTKEGNYAVIFMDLKMPVMNGLDATRKIRTFNSTIPIIAITASAFDSDREEALAAGCNKFIPKPIKMGDIVQIIKETME